MANIVERFSGNVPGPFFVDTNCIDCGLCVEIAPALFRLNGDGQSAVIRQPETDGDRALAREAIEGCPVEAIGIEEPDEPAG